MNELQAEAEKVWREAVDAFLRSEDKRSCAIAVISVALKQVREEAVKEILGTNMQTYHGVCPGCGRTLELERE